MDKANGKDLAGFKAALKKSGIEYATDEEYQKAFDNLVGYFDILIQMDQSRQVSKAKTSPESSTS